MSATKWPEDFTQAELNAELDELYGKPPQDCHTCKCGECEKCQWEASEDFSMQCERREDYNRNVRFMWS